VKLNLLFPFFFFGVAKINIQKIQLPKFREMSTREVLKNSEPYVQNF